ncbi:endo alpha-1,4 polygalactosaminidase [Streptomyces sp. NBC_01723]|uniref:endo alpha-1,4 polygalactosaminidase n=1 Tax=Streptomyces sp. NBC_01723 TaxID=2975921 RepID=UPI002E35ECE1|nr:endo alpha-1,4 polygalactosaminidase [Streptomyces sp. NBC_01723]
MSRTQVHTSKKPVLAGVCAAAVLATAAALVPGSTPAEAAVPAPPPAHADFDYQIGGAYTPPSGVRVVSRDHTASPAAGLYNICYVNAFQAQRGAEDEWDDDLLLRDAGGDIVYDTEWKEALLDLRTADKRERVAEKIGTWIDSCGEKGFQAVEPDNYDSYTRSEKLLDAADAQAFVKLLAERAHADGLAIGQKNTVELAGNRVANGLDFAVAEECGEWDECGDYTAEFGDHVIVIEYTAKGLSKACSGFADTLSIVRRDLDVSPKGSSSYVRETC